MLREDLGLEPLLSLEAPGEAEREALAELLPALVGAGIHHQVIAADIVGDVLVETGFEPSHTIELVRLVIDRRGVGSTTKVIAGYSALFHPCDDFPLQEVAGAVRGLFANTSAIFVEALVAKTQAIGGRDHFALEIGKEQLPVAFFGKPLPELFVVFVCADRAFETSCRCLR